LPASVGLPALISMHSRTVLFFFPEQVTVNVDVVSTAAPESTLMLPYDPEALVTLQLCASAGEETASAMKAIEMRRSVAFGGTDPARSSIRGMPTFRN
jgi:hypothetical protein